MLLDTHIFLWWLFDDPKLSRKIRNIMRDFNNPIFVSSASVWEIATKYRLGKLPASSSVAENVPYWITKAGFKPLVISPEHAQLSGSWDLAHRDPFDRMLAAQSKLEDFALISVDKALSLFPIKIIK
ncbi:MAG: type II toxin-antitoxin system VapC family toxin [Deltaproteobacteria bacterium]|jgi:PIN domain nuclease of toxin-antitoxin system|nr:type II toxin-antitoxin system VapC family toxin [Deltaproteobacteria bacterium]